MLVIVALSIEYWCKKYDILFVLVCVFVSVKDNDNDMYNFWHESGLSTYIGTFLLQWVSVDKTKYKLTMIQNKEEETKAFPQSQY